MGVEVLLLLLLLLLLLDLDEVERRRELPCEGTFVFIRFGGERAKDVRRSKATAYARL
jgi:hypothetical protein